jgi:hypothetical protein
MRGLLRVGLVLLGVFAVSVQAAEIWTDIGSQIATFDSDNPGVINYIGPTGKLPLDGMDFTTDGTLYGVCDREVLLVNQTNGSVQSLGFSQLVNDEIYMDISWDPVTSTMYGIGGMNPSHLYQINLSNAAATLVGTINISYPSSSAGLATTAAGVRYIDDTEHNGLWRLAGLDGTFLGPEGFDSTFFGGMTIDWSNDGVAYHATWNAGSMYTELWTVDLVTGVGTYQGVIGSGVLLLSAAIKPVPEPAGLMALALLMACARRRSRCCS